MSDDMGSFRVEVEVTNMAQRHQSARLTGVLVDTGAELSWFPAVTLDALGVMREHTKLFRQATGEVVERWTGMVAVTVIGITVGDHVVFGESGDQTLLGARSLEGLNLMVDPVNRRLVDAGAMPAAAAA
jgi:predicted aspartyl protease